MNKILIYDQYDETYRDVIDVEELAKYIQDLIIKIKDKKIEDMFITPSQGKIDTIIVLDTILKDLEVEDD